MQLINLLPKLLLKHKFIQFLLLLKLQKKHVELSYNKGSKAIIDLSDPEPRNVYIKKDFDAHFFSVVSCFLPKSGTFFDLGANYGLCSFGLLPKYSFVDFHLFEANSFLIPILSKSLKLHSRNSFHLNHACISDKNGTTKFYLEEKQSGQSHVATKHEDGQNVKNLIMDDYCMSKNIEIIDFAKIDLEGHEISALKGWKNYLKEYTSRSTS